MPSKKAVILTINLKGEINLKLITNSDVDIFTSDKRLNMNILLICLPQMKKKMCYI